MSDQSGRGDPARTLELLWGTREPPSRGPKPGLTVDQIVRTAIDVADAEGLGALSMRRLATELGVGTMSLYRYVPGKDELVDVMLDAVYGEVEAPGPEVSGWRAVLEHCARGGWAMHQRHPWVAGAYTRPVLGPNVFDAYEAMLRSFGGTGLAPGDVVNAVELVGGYVDGAARRAGEDHLGDEQWWAERDDFWDRYFDVDRYPTITAMYESQAYDARAGAFEFGLQRVLDGIEACLPDR